MNEHLPVCVALQETLLKPSCTSNIRGYSILRKDCNTGERACGGVALLINHATPFSPVLIRTSLQAVAVCDNYTTAFQSLKRREERVKLNFSSSNEEGSNSPPTLLELRVALHRSGNTAAGPDGLHHIMLRHLSESSILSLLLLFNRIWETQVFPTQWCHVHVLPFPKLGKDPTSVNNYRPIALTSCLSKLMERIVSARLMSHITFFHHFKVDFGNQD
ncbi:putative RNA-directed DNA polymerase from transposon X-element [Trichonephila clavata]|uniref:Putative RNA-directed DNA polymerase from transposon X-element n=1 Tax=Trichonephila clavata TaxID=2740835 RepID=A0A8X6M0G5_TRICU|nr:putative RNA-directed DNA polymerase from transposon X-element [Trichonephila clavata]